MAANFDNADPIAAAADYLLKLHGQVSQVNCAGMVTDPNDKELHDEYKPLSEAYNELEQALKSPELSVPLKIQQCWPMSSNLRGTSIIQSRLVIYKRRFSRVED